jgi:hypothetical protein
MHVGCDDGLVVSGVICDVTLGFARDAYVARLFDRLWAIWVDIARIVISSASAICRCILIILPGQLPVSI